MFTYAGFWRRFFAFIVDGIIVSIVEVLLMMLVRKGAPVNVTAMLIQWLYFAGLESSAMQATLGKRLLGIKVTDLEGNRIGFGRATGRYFAKIISAIILLIGYIMAAFTKKKQALHDMIAGTLVLRSSEAMPPSP